jgi:hypothetical protein
MTHVRRQIRDRLAAVLDSFIPTAKVTSGSMFDQNFPDADLLIEVVFVDEQIDEETMGSDIQRRLPSFQIRVQRVSADGVDDLLDADEVVISDAIFSVVWDDLCLDDPEISRVQLVRGAEGGSGVSALVITVGFDYRASKDDLETPKG